MDPRVTVIEKRLANVKRLIAVGGGKGGIGKSSVASVLALTLAKAGRKVGLLDLDFCGPSAHVILGIKDVYPTEEKGVHPPEIHGIKFMSIIYYAGDNPSPLRGIDISNAIIELLAITQWGELDFLIVDMPPGTGDSTLDTIRLISRMEFLIVTTRSKVALETVKKAVQMLKELQVPIIGIVENMRMARSPAVKEAAEQARIPFLGAIDFDSGMEEALGNANKLLKSRFAHDLPTVST
jgi:ATP-binding protein involved in chromosome partitioning